MSTKREILLRLTKIAGIGGGARSPMICSDLINQDQLYDVQEKLQDLMRDIANDPEVPDGPALLSKAFPYIFKLKKV